MTAEYTEEYFVADEEAYNALITLVGRNAALNRQADAEPEIQPAEMPGVLDRLWGDIQTETRRFQEQGKAMMQGGDYGGPVVDALSGGSFHPRLAAGAGAAAQTAGRSVGAVLGGLSYAGAPVWGTVQALRENPTADLLTRFGMDEDTAQQVSDYGWMAADALTGYGLVKSGFNPSLTDELVTRGTGFVPRNFVPSAGQVGPKNQIGAIGDISKLADKPRVFYRGISNSGKPSESGNATWDSLLFATSDEDAAKLYAGSDGAVYPIHAKSGTNILYEGTQEFRSLNKGNKGKDALESSAETVRRAKDAGYDAVHFSRQADIGTAIINPDAFDVSQLPKTKRPKLTWRVEESSGEFFLEGVNETGEIVDSTLYKSKRAADAALKEKGQIGAIGDVSKLTDGVSYPTAPKGNWYGDADYRERGGRIVSMSPDEFLDSATPLKIDDVARDNIDELKRHIRDGGELDPLALYGDKTSVRNSDGRHRAIAARELGMSEVPVLDFRATADDLPTDHASRMQRAREQGFGERVFYHGTKQDIEGGLEPGYDDGLIFLTPNKKFAEDWAGKGRLRNRKGAEAEIDAAEKAERKLRNEVFNWEELSEMERPELNAAMSERTKIFNELNPVRSEDIHKTVYPVRTRVKRTFHPDRDFGELDEYFKKRNSSESDIDLYRTGNYLLFETKEMVDYLKGKGFDSMWLKESTIDNEYTTLAVFDPKDIRSINAKFDPKDIDSRNIMAGVGAGAVAASLDDEEYADIYLNNPNQAPAYEAR